MNKNDMIKRYAIIMMVGVILNFGLYNIAHVFKLPLWLDNIGTTYTALMLEPAAGLLVAFVSNFYQAAVVYDSSSLVYYAVSAAAALVIGVGLRKSGKICWKRMAVTIVCYVITGTILAAGLTLWRTAGIPDSGWERHFYELALGAGVPNALACFFGTVILKIADGIVIAVLLPILYFITPKRFVTTELKEVVSWKNPYFGEKEV